MLTRTFQHLPGVGDKTEQDLWARGVHTWQDFLDRKDHLSLGRSSRGLMTHGIEQSLQAIEEGDPAWFTARLHSRQHWRLLPDFEEHFVYLDIETTGSSYPACHLTTIGIYDGERAQAFVRDRNLEAFRQEIQRFRALVTYNGKCFDAPWIEAEMGVKLPAAHIDLRFVLGALGLKGGLKSVERQVGIGRSGTLAEVDGWFAVLLWRHFERTGDERALETLIRYNLEDVVKLKPLLQIAYNRALRTTPFAELPERRVEPVLEVDVPIHSEVVREIQARDAWRWRT